MASITSTTLGRAGHGGEGEGAGLRFERVGADRRRTALAVLLTGSTTDPGQSVDRFLSYSRDEGMSLDELWVAWQANHQGGSGGESPAAATLIVPCPGRTAMQFVSPASAWPSVDAASALFGHAARSQDPAQVRLIQALLEPEQPRTQQALQQAGFDSLATLAYMRGRANVSPHHLVLEDLVLAQPAAGAGAEPVRTLRWERANHAAFEHAILASYEQTRDCPGLLGRREVTDIVDGHMAAGRFRPDLWEAYYLGDDPVGVLLLNEVPPSDALELVYLGIAVPWRGRGLGKRLVRYALGQAVRCGRSRLILAVDERNEPALRLYRGLGFRTTGRKHAMIFTLSQ